MSVNLRQLFRENRSLLLFLLLMLLFRSSLADWNSVPTGSMKPTIVEGDRIFVNKMAYDLKIPLTDYSLYRTGEPGRGDIVTFNSSAAEKRLVKRVIGVPGDEVMLLENRLYVNGVPAVYSDLQPEGDAILAVETIAGLSHPVRFTPTRPSPLRNFGPVRVPDDHYLVLGDNRDNSSDSRVFGFVPRREISGRSRSVVMSLDYDNFYLPRSDRFLHNL